MYYAIYYAINDLVSWLCRAPLLWDLKDVLIIACELYSIYYVTSTFGRWLIAKVKDFSNKRRVATVFSELEKLYKRK